MDVLLCIGDEMNAKNAGKILVFGAIAILLGSTFLPIGNPNLLHAEIIGKESAMESDILNDNPSQINLPIVPVKKSSASNKIGIIDESMNGTTLYVGGSGPGNYSNIQDAINDANDGDTVFVYDDSSPYYENVLVDKSINLIGENRDTTVIDGEDKNAVSILADSATVTGFTVRNKGLAETSGIVIKSNGNMVSANNIINCDHGFFLYRSSNNIISNNLISSNSRGIYLLSSNNNTLFKNIISLNGVCIWLYSSNNNTISNNKIYSSYGDGIKFGNSSNNIISGNNISENHWDGIRFFSSNTNTISDNNISSNTECGICSIDSDENVITGNTISHNGFDGIYLDDSGKTIISFNKVSSNGQDGIYLTSDGNAIYGNFINSNTKKGIYITCSHNDTLCDNTFLNDSLYVWNSRLDKVFNNTVNGKPLVYLEKKSDEVIEEETGQIILTGCNNITIKGQQLYNTDVSIEVLVCKNCFIFNNRISNNNKGIYLYFSRNIVISDNIISNNKVGIKFEMEVGYTLRTLPGYSTKLAQKFEMGASNIVRGNNIWKNQEGIYLLYSDYNNIHHNNFIKNSRHAYFVLDPLKQRGSLNFWNNNYWDRPRIFPKPIFGSGFPPINFDWHPLLEPYKGVDK